VDRLPAASASSHAERDFDNAGHDSHGVASLKALQDVPVLHLGGHSLYIGTGGLLSSKEQYIGP
jgi:hypothetical protein